MEPIRERWAMKDRIAELERENSKTQLKYLEMCKTANRYMKERDLLAEGIKAIEALINESRGVAGLHLNGNIALWDELLAAGRHEEWLVAFSEALALLEKE